MNEDAIAAVAIAAMLLARRERVVPATADAARWALAARVPIDDAAEARLVARTRSRWTFSGRRRD